MPVVIPSGYPRRVGARQVSELIADLTRAVGDQLSERGLAAAGVAVRSAIDVLNEEDLRFTRNWEEFTLVADDDSYIFTAGNVGRVLSVELWKPSSTSKIKNLGYLPIEVFQRLYRESDTDGTGGTPHHYTFRNLYKTGTIRVHPRPDSANAGRVLRVWYKETIPYPADTSSGYLDIPPFFNQFIFWYALSELHTVITRDLQQAAWAQSKAMARLRKAKHRDYMESQDWIVG